MGEKREREKKSEVIGLHATEVEVIGLHATEVKKQQQQQKQNKTKKACSWIQFTPLVNVRMRSMAASGRSSSVSQT